MFRVFTALAVAACFSSTQASAQSFGSPGYGPAGGYGGGGSGGYASNCCGDTRVNPRLGYCLKNDCFCRDCSRQCPGCGSGCGGSGYRVTVRVNGQVLEPNSPLCPNCYNRLGSGGLSKEELYRRILQQQRVTSARPPAARPLATSPASPASYRYRY